MASTNGNPWVHTHAALRKFMENFNCNKCKTAALEPIRYQQCGHLFCTGCIKSKSRCPACNTQAKRNDILPDIIAPKLITYGNSISQIIKAPHSQIKSEAKARTSSSSAKQEDISLVIPNVPKGIDKPNDKGETRLHRACLKPNADAVRRLLETGANPNTKDHSNWPPLHEAISFQHYEIAKLLLDAGALPNTPGNENRTALHEAAKLNDVEAVKLVLEYNADVNARDSYGKIPLDYAETEEVRKILLDYKPVENILEKTLANCTIMTNISHNNFTRNNTNVLGLKLSSESSSLLNKVAIKHKIKLSKTLTSAVTHVVVEVNDQGITDSGYEVLLTIIHGKWMLNHQWMAYCMSIEDLSIMELEPFEVQGTTGAPRSNTPTRARENEQMQNPRLFNNCNFFFAMNKQSTYPFEKLEFTKAKLSKLVLEGGGKVLSREPKPESVISCKEIPFHVARHLTHALHRCTHYIIYVPGKDEPAVKYNMPHIKSLPLIWFIESIEQFELLDPSYIGILVGI